MSNHFSLHSHYIFTGAVHDLTSQVNSFEVTIFELCSGFARRLVFPLLACLFSLGNHLPQNLSLSKVSPLGVRLSALFRLADSLNTALTTHEVIETYLKPQV